MAETAPQLAPLPDDLPPLAFADLDGAKKWAKSLPLLPVAQAYQGLIGQLRALAAATIPPRERATLAEVFREPVFHLHAELARRYAGKPQPAGDRELESAEQAIAMWQALWEQYSMCLKPLLEGDAELAGVKSKLLQRGLAVGKQLILVHGLARRLPPATLWQEIHAYYRLAEMMECAVQAVSDDLAPLAVGVSCYSTYSHALLLALADPCSMTVRQIEIADRWLSQWARKVFPYAEQRETEGLSLVVDLDSGAGASLVVVAPRSTAPSMRFCYPGKLATSVRGRLKRLAQGASPAELALGHDVSVEQSITLLSHLDAHWYQTRRHGPATTQTVELCGGGVAGAYFRVCGRTFDRKDPLGRLTYQGSQHLATLGALTDYDRFREEAERNLPWERWQGRYEWREAALNRVGSAHHRWFLEQLVTLRDDERTRMAMVTRVALDASGGLAIELKLWPGSPRTVAVRPQSSAFSEDPPLPTIELCESPDEASTLIVPSRTFAPGRQLRSMDSGPERRFKLTKLVQRGADFERCAFEETA
jgi:cyclic-di-GMP-binding protein